MIFCQINAGGVLNTVPGFNTDPAGMAINNSGTLLYVITRGTGNPTPNVINKCPINSSDGSIGACTGTSLLHTAGVDLAINSANTLIYTFIST